MVGVANLLSYFEEADRGLVAEAGEKEKAVAGLFGFIWKLSGDMDDVDPPEEAAEPRSRLEPLSKEGVNRLCDFDGCTPADLS